MKRQASTPKSLLKQAARAARSAHCPYSHFKVGAAVRAADGRVFTGCNVENASFGLTLCAERAAIAAAVTAGAWQVVAIAIAASGTAPTPPCGACRQVIAEFADDDCVVYAAPLHNLANACRWSLSELLPGAFRLNRRRRSRA